MAGLANSDTNLICEPVRSDPPASGIPLIKATVYTQVERSPLTPLAKGGNRPTTGLKSPFLRGI